MNDDLPPGGTLEVDKDEVGNKVQFCVDLGAVRVEARQKPGDPDRWIVTPE